MPKKKIEDEPLYAPFEEPTRDEQEELNDLATRATNGAAEMETPTSADPQWEKLMRLDEEMSHFDGVIEHHKSEMKEAREARDQVLTQMRQLITGHKPLPLFGEGQAEGEEPYDEDAGPSL